ncbi:MAG: hypothetical protein ACR2PX_00935 [Endozoicomonas sp.]|uniref:hypothetical protein n=1 Tax=Endozoicomonas sp. TaxID=1892382 RepID=UPI003D9AE65A
MKGHTPAQDLAAQTALELIQLYNLIQTEQDNVRRLALLSCWRMKVQHLAHRQPRLYLMHTLPEEFQAVLDDL